MDKEVQFLYKCHEGKQAQFQASEAEEVLYGGAAGGGKSYALRAWAVQYCMRYPKAKVVLFRRTYRELEDTHIITIVDEVPKSVAHYAPGKHDLEFHDSGSVLMFRYCEKEEDARKYDTAEFDAMLFDELTHFTETQYTYLLSRLRSTKDWWPGRRIRCAATPLGIGHAWVKERFVDPVPHGEVWTAPEKQGGFTRQFIPAKATDNYTLMAKDPNYLRTLRGMSEEEYRAKALGDWSVGVGQFFKKWTDSVHVIEPYEIPREWPRYMCVDYGFNAPYAVLWFTRPPNTDLAIVYREHYGKGIKLDEQVRLAWEANDATAERIQTIVLDPSMFGKVNVKGERIASMATNWKKEFGNTRILPGNNERVPGWRLIRNMIDWNEGPDKKMLKEPRLKVFNTCRNLIRTLPRLIVDNVHVEDVNTKMEDHAPDALRYGLMHAFAGSGSPSRRRVYRIRPGRITVS